MNGKNKADIPKTKKPEVNPTKLQRMQSRLNARIKDYEVTIKQNPHPDMFHKPGRMKIK